MSIAGEMSDYDEIRDPFNVEFDRRGQVIKIQHDQIIALRARVAELEAEIERLKGDLDTANKAIADAITYGSERENELVSRILRLREALERIAQFPQDDKDADEEVWLDYPELVDIARQALRGERGSA